MERTVKGARRVKIATKAGTIAAAFAFPVSSVWVLVCCAILELASLPAYAQSSIPRDGAWVPNGAVRSIASSSATIYIAGNFTCVGPNTGNGVVLDKVAGQPKGVFPQVNGPVHACVSDGSGGWFIGGEFTSAGGLTRNNTAHILADGSVDSVWDGNVSDSGSDPAQVWALAVAGSVVYVGGQFTNAGGQSHSGLAALDTTTGLALNWDANMTPSASGGQVRALLLTRGLLYVGGAFSTIGGKARIAVAALDPATATATDWNPPLTNELTSIAPRVDVLAGSGNTVYLAGSDITSIGGQTRYGLGAVDATTGLATGWDPNTTHITSEFEIHALAVSANVVYVGGRFNALGGQPRTNVAAVDALTGLATAWNPSIDSLHSSASPATVLALAVTGTTVYAGGRFEFVDSALELTNGVFRMVGGYNRANIAALDASTGLATSWNPVAGGPVSALAATDDSVFAGGSFWTIGGKPRVGIAALDAKTGVLTPWDPALSYDCTLTDSSDGSIDIAVLSGNLVYVHGAFTEIGGSRQTAWAALDTLTASATGWNPNAVNPHGGHASAFRCARLYDKKLYLFGGLFVNETLNVYNYVDTIETTTGVEAAWDTPQAKPFQLNNTHSAAFELTDGTAYLGGQFASAGGQSRNNIAAFDATTRLATAWNPNAQDGLGGIVNALAASGNLVYAGGSFGTIGGQSRRGIAALDSTTGLATDWNPTMYDASNPYPPSIDLISVHGATVYVGGFFFGVGGQTRHSLAALDATSGAALDWNPDANGKVLAMVESKGIVYAGGGFTTIGNRPRPYFAIFDGPPSVTSSMPNGANPTGASTTQFAVIISESVSGLDVSDFTLTSTGSISGAAVSSVTGSGTTYTVSVNTGSGSGTLRLDVIDDDTIVGTTTALPLGGAGVGNGDFSAGEIVTIDKVAPTVVMNSASPLVTRFFPIPVSVTFSKPVTGFTADDVVVGNATLGGFTGSAATYSFNLIPLGQGTVTVDIGAGVAQDLAANGNTAAAQFSRVYDATGPTLSIGAPSEATTSTGPVTYAITYVGADTVDLSSADVTLNKTGTANAVVGVLGVGNVWTVTLSNITGNGTLGISIAAETASDAAGNSAPASGPSATFVVDNVSPTVTIKSPTMNTTNLSPIPVTVTFSEPVTGFTVDAVVTTNTAVTNFTGSGAVYTFSLTPTTAGAVTARVPGGAATDASGNVNQPSATLTRTYDPTAPNPDIRGDGNVDAVDVQLVINKALGFTIDGDADVDHDGVVNAVDVQLVINFALGVG